MNRADHLMHGSVRIHMQERIDGDAAGNADASEIVADHVGNHQIFRPVLFVVRKPLRNRAVGGGNRGTLRGSFHRGTENAASVRFQKEFGRERKDAAFVKVQKRRIRNRMTGGETQEQLFRERRLFGTAAECQIRLIDVAVMNMMQNIGNLFIVFLFGELRTTSSAIMTLLSSRL